MKIFEEYEARRNGNQYEDTNAMVLTKFGKKSSQYKGKANGPNNTRNDTFKFRCHKCKEIGHKAIDCNGSSRWKKKYQQAKCSDNVDLCTGIRNSSEDWCLDSGATSHFCKREDSLVNKVSCNSERLNLANSAHTVITAKGATNFTSNVNGRIKNVSLKHALCVPDLRVNLLSVSKITEKGLEVNFRRNDARILNTAGDVCLVAKRINDLYYIQNTKQSVCIVNEESQDISKWHRILGHLNFRDLIIAKRSKSILILQDGQKCVL